MEVILDELTPVEFFRHGGIVKVTITNDDLVKECNVKKKTTFFDYKDYTRFFRNLYMTHMHNNQDKNSFDVYKFVNESVELNPSIGQYEYVIDLNYDKVRSYEAARFYYLNDRNEPETSSKDPYGIKNVCFSVVKEDDENWEKYEQQRLTTGFDESELWDFDGTIAKFIYPRLKVFFEQTKKSKRKPNGIDYNEWENILKQMVDGFELISSDRMKTKDEDELEKKTLELFSKYFFYLWL